ncbi:hypothetical protein LJ655_14180 [Paraburkholderia sp. MMS20-SJTN17]|uniref:Heat induced stress protein YflT n=1 Tax=Paraburkholderia translucens TaxID=2886945 RepID=A0ABS8KF26_9BURK|nr:hypothetical protein [Paraburkholderia sp. MMS20-SJTN17]MCC8403019.1 hypothetical protein [Paraburkholderia sp. MMS20-SJTN17]
MEHTVIGLFDTYMQAEAARDTLVRTGFAREKIELQANAGPSVGSATSEVANGGVLANIERFLASLFSTGPRSSDTARYAEAMRRGAVLVCVHATSESHAELARNTLVRLGATDVGDRPPEPDTPAGRDRDHSVLDELGIGAVMPGTPRTSSVTTEAGAKPGTQPSEIVPEVGQPGIGPGAQMPDECLEYEEDFRSHHDEHHAAEDARYEDYVPAYRYGTEIGRDARFRDRPWEEIEPEARRYWEATAPDIPWERFKLAVRHGWERVTGHHHV